VGGYLTIDLDALAENYRILCRALDGVACAAVVKADGYGLGAHEVGPALARAGARQFFVAQLQEAVALRDHLTGFPDHVVAVLNGLQPGTERDFLDHGILPVLNSLDEIARWRDTARQAGRKLPAILHVDTGISRLGLPADELDALASEPARLAGIDLHCVMSHLACADTPEHPLNAAQLRAFETALSRLPRTPACFANSSGIFLGPEYHFDLARPGVALYGVNPTPGKPSPMCQVVELKGTILQVRRIDAPTTVGYGATHRADGPMRLATVAAGYADGYLRSLSNRGTARIAGQRVPVVGRVSMDLITLDVTAVPEAEAHPGAMVELLGPEHDVDALADEAGTIGYEILTALGRRYHRRYVGGRD
jgi:alanine racemase